MGNILKLFLPVWKKAIILGWPVALNHVFSTAKRTTDMLLMGFFCPAAVAAVGLGDVWERLVLRMGTGLGTGSIALIAQETGKGEGNSPLVLSQALIIGVCAGIPFVVTGLLIPDILIRILGAEEHVVLLPAQYLSVVFCAAPFRVISIIATRSL